LFTTVTHIDLVQAKEMDELAERVKLTVESKDANIALLKAELANQQQQAFDILNGS
jgi:hypothetical protein